MYCEFQEKNANWARNDQDHIITLPQMYFLQDLLNYILQLDNLRELKIECPSEVKTKSDFGCKYLIHVLH